MLFQFSSAKEVENQLLSIRDILADANNDWEKRAEAVSKKVVGTKWIAVELDRFSSQLKRIRSVMAGGADQYDEFFRCIRLLDLPLVTTVKDLRSQIVREACITLAFMSVRMANRFERTAEGVIPTMLGLIQNSAKVISTSGTVALNYIFSNTQSSKFVPLILAGVESKSREIRRCVRTSPVLVAISSIYVDKPTSFW